MTTKVKYPCGVGELLIAEPDKDGVVIVKGELGEYRGVHISNIKPIDERVVSFWWMHDNHTFTRINGINGSWSEIVEHIQQLSTEDRYGMLCPVTLLNGDKEVRRVGTGVHPTRDWAKGYAKWVGDIFADAEVAKLIVEGKIK